MITRGQLDKEAGGKSIPGRASGKYPLPEEGNRSVCTWNRKPATVTGAERVTVERWEMRAGGIGKGRHIDSWVLVGREKQCGFCCKSNGSPVEGFRQGW